MGAVGSDRRRLWPWHLHRWSALVFSQCDAIKFTNAISWSIFYWHGIPHFHALQDSNAVTIRLSYDDWNAVILAYSIVIPFAPRAQ